MLSREQGMLCDVEVTDEAVHFHAVNANPTKSWTIWSCSTTGACLMHRPLSTPLTISGYFCTFYVFLFLCFMSIFIAIVISFMDFVILLINTAYSTIFLFSRIKIFNHFLIFFFLVNGSNIGLVMGSDQNPL